MICHGLNYLTDITELIFKLVSVSDKVYLITIPNDNT